MPEEFWGHPWIIRAIPESDLREWRDAAFLARSSDSPLVILHSLARMAVVQEKIERAAVKEARKQRASWADIAQALGRTRQSVHRRYADETG